MTVVEFGSGTGHIGLTLAALHPHCEVILAERKEWTSNIADERIAELGTR